MIKLFYINWFLSHTIYVEHWQQQIYLVYLFFFAHSISNSITLKVSRAFFTSLRCFVKCHLIKWTVKHFRCFLFNFFVRQYIFIVSFVYIFCVWYVMRNKFFPLPTWFTIDVISTKKTGAALCCVVIKIIKWNICRDSNVRKYNFKVRMWLIGLKCIHIFFIQYRKWHMLYATNNFFSFWQNKKRIFV